MEGLKKTLFGGYKKNSVDAAFNDINKKLIDSENDNKYLKRTSEEAAAKVSELEKKLEALSAENMKLQTENDSLKIGQSESNLVFKNIEKIYKRAYGTGYEIVTDSKDAAQEMLDKMDGSYRESLGNSEEILREYELIHDDIERMFTALSGEIISVRKNADAMLNRAKVFLGVCNEMGQVVSNAKTKNEIILSEYEADTSEFINNCMLPDRKESIAVSSEAPANTVVADEKPEAEKILPLHEVKSAEISEPKEDTVPHGQSTLRIATPPVRYEAEPEIEEDTTEDIVSVSNTDNVAESTAEFQEESAPTADTEDNSAVIAAATAATVAATSVAAATVAEESAPTPQVKPKADTSAKNGEFTQFGRKSRVSAQDRSELLRKALLKNGAAK